MSKAVVLVDWHPEAFSACPVSGRDAVTTRPWRVAWDNGGGVVRSLTVPEDWRFGVATDKVPGFAMAVLRGIVNCQHMQRSSCVHDLLYATQGGRRGECTCTGAPIVLPFDDVSREEADAVAHAIALEDGIAPWEASVVHTALRLFGQGAWND